MEYVGPAINTNHIQRQLKVLLESTSGETQIKSVKGNDGGPKLISMIKTYKDPVKKESELKSDDILQAGDVYHALCLDEESDGC